MKVFFARVAIGAYVVVFAVFAATTYLDVTATAAPAAPTPLVQVGQVYLVVESCSTSTGKCFGELHRVTQILEGQWVETKQCADENCSQTGQMWRINLARVYALRPYRGPNAHDAN